MVATTLASNSYSPFLLFDIADTSTTSRPARNRSASKAWQPASSVALPPVLNVCAHSQPLYHVPMPCQ